MSFTTFQPKLTVPFVVNGLPLSDGIASEIYPSTNDGWSSFSANPALSESMFSIENKPYVLDAVASRTEIGYEPIVRAPYQSTMKNTLRVMDDLAQAVNSPLIYSLLNTGVSMGAVGPLLLGMISLANTGEFETMIPSLGVVSMYLGFGFVTNVGNNGLRSIAAELDFPKSWDDFPDSFTELRKTLTALGAGGVNGIMYLTQTKARRMLIDLPFFKLSQNDVQAIALKTLASIAYLQVLNDLLGNGLLSPELLLTGLIRGVMLSLNISELVKFFEGRARPVNLWANAIDFCQNVLLIPILAASSGKDVWPGIAALMILHTSIYLGFKLKTDPETQVWAEGQFPLQERQRTAATIMMIAPLLAVSALLIPLHDFVSMANPVLAQDPLHLIPLNVHFAHIGLIAGLGASMSSSMELIKGERGNQVALGLSLAMGLVSSLDIFSGGVNSLNFTGAIGSLMISAWAMYAQGDGAQKD